MLRRMLSLPDLAGLATQKKPVPASGEVRPFVHNYRTFIGRDNTVRTKQHSVAYIEKLRNTTWT